MRAVLGKLGRPAAIAAALGLAACATVPPAGPSVMVLPGTRSDFNQFQRDQADCHAWAQAAMGGTAPARTATDNAVQSAVTGAAVGAAAGALLGAISGDADEGAAAGAGLGFLAGSAAGVGAYHETAAQLQDRYDAAFVQCMYAKGHQVPVPAGYTAQPAPLAPAPTPYPVPPGQALPPPPRS